jgi:hypothetical protein
MLWRCPLDDYQIFILGFAYIPRESPSDTSLDCLKMKKHLRRHTADCWLEYIYFMKIGQPKLSERKNQRRGLFVTRTSHYGQP